MTRKRERAAALDASLKGMFRALQARPLPDRLRSVVEQLDDGSPAAPSAAPARKSA